MMVSDSFVSFFFLSRTSSEVWGIPQVPNINFDILLSREAQSSEDSGSSLWSIKLVFFP